MAIKRLELDSKTHVSSTPTALALQIAGTSIELLPEGAVWLPFDRILVVGDLHFGKVNHFRRAGLPVPLAANQKNAERLIDLINKVTPIQILFLGDLFHSVYNDDWEVVGQIVKHFPGTQFQLIRGNHDVLSEQQYIRYGIVVKEQVQWGALLLTHEPMQPNEISVGTINIAGHIHPAARLVGKGRQSLTLPCFWRSRNQLVLPAFGSFTGFAIIRPQPDDQVYAIVDGQIIEMSADQRAGEGAS